MSQEPWHASRWIMRVIEWDDPRARYPNIWHEGMPSRILAGTRVARRLGLGHLIAIYYPGSRRHPERSERFLGLSRVIGLEAARQDGFAWVELETAHRFDSPLHVRQPPRRVFLSADPGWPESDVALFREVFDAAVAAGWQPTEEELQPAAAPEGAMAGKPADDSPPPVDGVVEEGATPERDEPGGVDPPHEEPHVEPTPPRAEDSKGGRRFAGVDYSGDMRDPRRGTWLAILELRDDRLHVARLEATGRHGLEGCLRDPDRRLMQTEAIGLDFPFGLPVPFAESLLGRPFPEEGWWALARRFEQLKRPEYLIALQEFRDEHGELKRLTDERARAFSPLHRVNPDLGPMTFHGIRMIAEDRSRYAVRPFESAQGQLLLEVYPGATVKSLDLPRGTGKPEQRRQAIVKSLSLLSRWPLVFDQPHQRHCVTCRDALDAVIAARCAAVAVLTGETDKSLTDLAPDDVDRVRYEGWIYGLGESEPPSPPATEAVGESSGSLDDAG